MLLLIVDPVVVMHSQSNKMMCITGHLNCLLYYVLYYVLLYLLALIILSFN